MIKVARFNPEAKLPTRKHPKDAGIDLYACLHEEIALYGYITIEPHSYEIIPTGVTIEIPEGYAGLVWPKGKADFLIGGGVVDEQYQGELLVKIFNPTAKPLYIYHHSPIAQLVIQPVLTEPVVEFSLAGIHKEKTDRGSTGGIVTEYKSASFTSTIEGVE
jgi:dUTP pyrophosphatase